jgi:hypothetical protein
MAMITKKLFYTAVTVLTIAILLFSWGIWIGAKSIFDGSYATIIKILTGGILVIWGGVCVTAEYLVWSWKKETI